jgi:hypothetical protein
MIVLRNSLKEMKWGWLIKLVGEKGKLKEMFIGKW